MYMYIKAPDVLWNTFYILIFLSLIWINLFSLAQDSTEKKKQFIKLEDRDILIKE